MKRPRVAVPFSKSEESVARLLKDLRKFTLLIPNAAISELRKAAKFNSVRENSVRRRKRESDHSGDEIVYIRPDDHNVTRVVAPP